MIVAVPGGLGVAPRRRSIGASGTLIKHVEGSSVAKHCTKNLLGETTGGLTHVSECGPGPKRSGASPRTPIVSVVPGTGNMA